MCRVVGIWNGDECQRKQCCGDIDIRRFDIAFGIGNIILSLCFRFEVFSWRIVRNGAGEYSNGVAYGMVF